MTVSDCHRNLLDALRAAADDRPWLCMVSGGSDSTALAYLAADVAAGATRPLAFFHAHHHLRGADADGDAAFVRRLADRLGVVLFEADLDVAGAVACGENLEAAARRLRYAAAFEALAAWSADLGLPAERGLLLTAHTRDDRVENFFMRALVGTGPGGFRGMSRRGPRLWRPLLDVGRDELRTLLKTRTTTVVDERTGLPWCEDATNEETDRLRAFVRHELIPLARRRSPALDRVLVRSMDLIADEDDYLADLARDAAEAHLRWIDGDGDAVADRAGGFSLAPAFGAVPTALARRVVHEALATMAGADARIDTRTVEAVLAAFANGRPVSGYVANIQGDLAVSANRRGVRVEPMERFRARRKPDRLKPRDDDQPATADQGSTDE